MIQDILAIASFVLGVAQAHPAERCPEVVPVYSYTKPQPAPYEGVDVCKDVPAARWDTYGAAMWRTYSFLGERKRQEICLSILNYEKDKQKWSDN